MTPIPGSFPGEIYALLAGTAMYLMFYFFGWRGQPGLRKQKPSVLFGIVSIGFALVIFLMAFFAAVHTGTPLRELDSHPALPRFVRHGYWFALFLMPTGIFELFRGYWSTKR